MGFILKWLGQLQRWPHARKFEKWKQEPMEAQEKLLLEIVNKNKDTEYGKKHSFEKIESIKDYQCLVPVVTYDDVQEYVSRMTKGEENVLTAEKPAYYCCTSGTTGKPKFNSITPTYRAQWQSAVHTFVYNMFNAHPRAADHEILYFVGSTKLGQTEDGTPFGTMSGYNYTTLPKFVQRLYAVPYEVFQIADLELKYYTLVRLAITRRLSFCVAITPTPLITVARTLEENIESLIKDVRQGSMERIDELPKELREVLEPRMAANPQRADELQKLVAEGKLKATTVWPDIAVMTCWIGAAAGMYVPELRSFYPGVPLRDAIFSATEGWCNVPLQDEKPGGPLAIHSHFFEFIPEEDYEKEERRVLTLSELEDGKRYFILLTTGGGCYRYDLRDVLQVDGFYGKIPQLKFVYKGKHCCNLAGEKMTEGHFNEAIQKIKEDEAEKGIVYFVAVPRKESGNIGYNLYIEAKSSVTDLETKLDDMLQEINWEYKSHRECGDLTKLSLVPLKEGNWQRIRQHLTEQGANEAQMKPPHLTEKEAFITLLEPKDKEAD